VSTNYLVHTQANPLESHANTDITPLNMSQPQNGRPAKRAGRDRISAVADIFVKPLPHE